MSIREVFIVIGLILWGAFLRLHKLFFGVFQADEALFSSWSRLIATGQDPLLLSQQVDKPPLFFYLQALVFPIFGAGDWAARLPNYLMSILIIPLVAVLTWTMYRDKLLSMTAAIVTAMSPLAISYSSTAFLDPLMTFLILLVMVIVVRGPSIRVPTGTRLPKDTQNGLTFSLSSRFTRGFEPTDRSYLAGFIFGLALATKYQAILFLPLIIGLALIFGWNRQQFLKSITSSVIIVLLVIVWDYVQDNQLNLIHNQWSSIGGLRLSWSWEIWARGSAWLHVWYSVASGPLLILMVFIGFPLVIFRYIIARDRHSWVDILLLSYLVAFGLLHWVVAIPVWSRYLYIVAPIAAILFASVAVQIWNYGTWYIHQGKTNFTNQFLIYGMPLLILMGLLLSSSLNARRGDVKLPDPSSPSADFNKIAAIIDNVPTGSVLYDHWYSWYWRYYLLERQIYVSWFPNPRGLAEDLAVFGNDGTLRLLALPNGQIADPVRRAVNEAGFLLIELTESNSSSASDVLLFRVVPRGQG